VTLIELVLRMVAAFMVFSYSVA